jgi:DNA adenine methylase
MKYLSLAKTHGGKGSKKILKWILLNFPKNYEELTFLDTCGGGASITLNKQPSIIEILNDIDEDTYLMYCAAKNGTLQRVKTVFGYTKNTFEYYRDIVSKKLNNNMWVRAETEYVLRNMSRGGMKKDFAWSNRLRGGIPGDVNAWNNKVAQLPEIKQRLQCVALSNQSVINLLKSWNHTDCFAYIDPPYLPETRKSKKIYTYEMTVNDHRALLAFLSNHWKGKYLISGYNSQLYRDWLGVPIQLIVSNNAGQTKTKSKRVECLWKNY